MQTCGVARGVRVSLNKCFAEKSFAADSIEQPG